MLASLDGTIGPAEETRIPVTDEGLTRGDGAFEVLRLYGGRPFAVAEHVSRLERTSAGLRLEFDVGSLRSEIDALLGAAGPVDALLRVVLTRGGRRILTVEPLPARPPVARVATVTYAPTRVLDGLKTLSYDLRFAYADAPFEYSSSILSSLSALTTSARSPRRAPTICDNAFLVSSLRPGSFLRAWSSAPIAASTLVGGSDWAHAVPAKARTVTATMPP